MGSRSNAGLDCKARNKEKTEFGVGAWNIEPSILSMFRRVLNSHAGRPAENEAAGRQMDFVDKWEPSFRASRRYLAPEGTDFGTSSEFDTVNTLRCSKTSWRRDAIVYFAASSFPAGLTILRR